MEEYVIDDAQEPDTEAPMDFIQAIWEGKGGIIRVAPNAVPSKVLWSLKNVLKAIAIGWQWRVTDKLVADGGWHPERAEAHISAIINNLIDTELPIKPTQAELNDLVKKHYDVKEEESNDSLPE